MRQLKILTFNVRQWTRDLNKSDKFYWKDRAVKMAEFIREQDPDIILFQEMTFKMSLFIPKEYKVKKTSWHIHRCKALIQTTDGDLINAISVHSHWDEKIYTKVAEQLKKDCISSPKIINIVGGDWNTDPDNMKNIIKPYTIVKSNTITFHNYTNPEQFGELDYFCIYHLAYDTPPKFKIKCFDDQFEKISDHLPVILTMTR